MPLYHAYSKGLHFCGPDVKLMVHEEGFPFDVKLVREPENPYDENAIEVHLNAIKIGHVAKEIAAWLAPRMDSGEDFASKCTGTETHGRAEWLTLQIQPIDAATEA